MRVVKLSKKKQYQTLGILGALVLVIVVISPMIFFFAPLWIVLGLLIKFTPVGRPVSWAYLETYDWLFYRSDKPRKFLWGFMYDSMCTLHPQTKFIFWCQQFRWSTMNYGYALLNENGKTIRNLDSELEEERFCLQLYHYVATQLNEVKTLRDQTVLEVGSGRGGGLNFISQYLEAAQCIGVDYSDQQVLFCQEAYKDNRSVRFVQGDSENLSIIPGLSELDLVINIESSHCYGNFARFVQQVYTVLRKGGLFVIADFREINHVAKFEEDIASSGFKLVRKEDISVNVLHALKLDEKRKAKWINNNTNFCMPLVILLVLRPLFRKFSGMTDTRIFNDFKSRRCVYIAQVWQK